MSLRSQNLLSLLGLALALMVGSCESLRIGANPGLEPRSAVEGCCASSEAG